MKKTRKAKQFLEELKTVPLVSLACEKVGLSRNTVYRWRKKDEEFASAMEEVLSRGTDSINDLSESKLINAIQMGEKWAIMFWLSNNKKNYAKPRPKDFWEKFSGSNKVDSITVQFMDMSGKRIDPKKNDEDSPSDTPNH